MKFTKDLSIGIKLFLGFGLLLAMMLMLSAFSLLRIQSVSSSVEHEAQFIAEKLEPWYTVREALGQTGIAARNAFIFTNEAEADKELDLVDQQKTIYLEALNKLAPHYQGNNNFEKINQGLRLMAEELKRPREFRNSGKIKEYGEFLVNECTPLRRQIVNDIAVLIESAQKEMTAANNAVKDASNNAMIFITLASIIAILIGISLSIALSRGITNPIVRAVAFAKQIATGDLTGHMSATSKDEIGELVIALEEMNSNLLKIVGEVRQRTETINSASNQIASGVHDLSSRTEEQASSLEETAASMEELASTVKQNSLNAAQANQLTHIASGIAIKGGNVVADVVSTMSTISESSKNIEEIISVIDGISFQTNILALNAAVEAARAGEQGRGFAVVATEVRNLAQRSATAAKEIKTLINSSVNNVEKGATQVAEAGKTMGEIVESVKRVTAIVAEITSATQEQSSGIEQINEALIQMDHMTQKNVTLVETASSDAQSLSDQANGLSQAVSIFKIDRSQKIIQESIIQLKNSKTPPIKLASRTPALSAI